MGNLSEKQLFIIVIIVAVLVSGAFGGLSYLEWQKIEDRKVQIEQVQKEIDKFRQKERKIVNIENDLTYMRPQHIENQKALPDYPFDDALLKGIQAQATAAKVDLLSFLPEKKASSSRTQRGKSSGPWDTCRFTMNVQGRYFDLLRFLNLIEHYPRLLSVKSGDFKAKLDSKRAPAKPKTEPKPGEEGEKPPAEETVGPLIELKMTLESYLTKSTPKPAAKAPAAKAPAAKAPAAKAPTAKTPAAKAPAHEAPAPPPLGDVYKLDRDFKVPDDEQVKVENNRRNPFVVWLEPKKQEQGEGPDKGPKTPVEETEIKALIKSWKDRLDALTVMQAHRDKPKETYFNWKNLVEEVTRHKLPHPYNAKREEILQSLLAEGFRGQILSEYDAYLEEVARKYRMRMETGFHVGMPDEVAAAFREFLVEILAGDRLPTRVRKEMVTAMGIFLDTLKVLVEEEGEYKSVLDYIAGVKKIISDEWKQKPFMKEFIDSLEEYQAKAQALVEFFSMDILVSGLVWLPDNAKSKRVAIVNDHAVLEGEILDIAPKKRVITRAPKEKGAPPVTLEKVGRDRFVWFGYKGLKIKYPLGEKPKKSGK